MLLELADSPCLTHGTQTHDSSLPASFGRWVCGYDTREGEQATAALALGPVGVPSHARQERWWWRWRGGGAEASQVFSLK